jgi:hypothetical protein
LAKRSFTTEAQVGGEGTIFAKTKKNQGKSMAKKPIGA